MKRAWEIEKAEKKATAAAEKRKEWNQKKADVAYRVRMLNPIPDEPLETDVDPFAKEAEPEPSVVERQKIGGRSVPPKAVLTKAKPKEVPAEYISAAREAIHRASSMSDLVDVEEECLGVEADLQAGRDVIPEKPITVTAAIRAKLGERRSHDNRYGDYPVKDRDRGRRERSESPNDNKFLRRHPRPSVGSAGHPHRCLPCGWYHKKEGCKVGEDCTFCHMCDHDERSIRRRLHRREKRAEAAAKKQEGDIEAPARSRSPQATREHKPPHGRPVVLVGVRQSPEPPADPPRKRSRSPRRRVSPSPSVFEVSGTRRPRRPSLPRPSRKVGPTLVFNKKSMQERKRDHAPPDDGKRRADKVVELRGRFSQFQRKKDPCRSRSRSRRRRGPQKRGPSDDECLRRNKDNQGTVQPEPPPGHGYGAAWGRSQKPLKHPGGSPFDDKVAKVDGKKIWTGDWGCGRYVMIWNPRSDETKKEHCKFHNFAKQDECKRCGAPRPDNVG